MANSKELIEAATSRLTAGTLSKRYKEMDRGMATTIIHDAIDELMDLRSELHEVYCRECNAMYPSGGKRWTVTCPKCKAPMTSMAHAQLRALRNQVKYLEDRIAHLIGVVEAFSEFPDETPTEGHEQFSGS